MVAEVMLGGLPGWSYASASHGFNSVRTLPRHQQVKYSQLLIDTPASDMPAFSKFLSAAWSGLPWNAEIDVPDGKPGDEGHESAAGEVEIQARMSGNSPAPGSHHFVGPV